MMMKGSLRPISFLFLAFLFIPNYFFFFYTGLSKLRCIHTERQALLNFKQHLIDPSNRLSSWTAHGDCCQWVGVVCHNLTAHGSLGFLFLAFLIIRLPNFFIFCTGHSHSHNFFIFCTGHSHSHSQLRCIDTERHALLTFKQDLIDPLNRLSSWTVDGDCCHWLGVVCHNLTAHVHQLHLRSFPPSGGFESEEQYEAYERSMFGGKLNPSLLDLKHLNYFDLSFNNFSHAGFVGLTPHQLGNLSNLLYLNLESSRTYGLYVNNLEWLSGLPLLQHLDLSFVNLSKASDWLQLTNTLPSLLELRLSYCHLPFIPLVVDVHNMTSLRHLDLSGNYFNSSIPNWLYSFSHVEFLNLGYNNLQGPIPVSFGNLSSLRNLDFSYNQFSGTLPQNLGQLKNLVELSFSQNSISGPIPMSLGNLSSLTNLDFSHNLFNGTFTLNFGQLKNLISLSFGIIQSRVHSHCL
ncbi:receptor-like protein eix2 [Quercus suber]|uniref:Receptor-like protein eix2 n=1 Tax=Quercus suber TaxID=58331 RepID=A0AAW0L1L0_QUESU